MTQSPAVPARRLRSLLFAPGNRADVCRKLPRSAPDAAVLDLEDSVPAPARAAARPLVRELAVELARAHPDTAWYVRVNPVPSPDFAADVAGALAPEIDGVVVPKLDAPAQVEDVVRALDAAGLGHVGVLAGIETAHGVEHAGAILTSAGVTAGYFGAEDFIADMGGVRTPDGAEVLYARSRVALAGRLAGVPVVDQAVTAFGDDDRFVADALAGRSLGYRGKLCIHPSQVPLAHRVFSASPSEAERARRLLEAYEQAVAAGEAAIAFEGQMIDEALVRQARSLLALTDD
jgi:citrate lyase subunit beta/citryl-CoA lyase